MDNNRLALLEQKVTVLQREISEVLQEMQVTMQGLTVTYGTALKVMNARLNDLEKQLLPDPIRIDESGRDL